MILEVDEENRDFISVYKKDFYPKKGRRSQPHVQRSEYSFPLNPLNGPFKEHLYSLRKNAKLEPSERSEDISANLERVRLMHPDLKKVLPDHTPNEDLIELRDKKALKTVYQVDYSTDLDNYLSLTARRTGGDRPRISLPEGWVIPETVQKISYRNPRELAPELATVLPRRERPTDNLNPKEKERLILGVTTGESNYGATISTLGEKIIGEHIYGLPLPLEPPVPHIIGPDSVRSDCSMTLLNPKYPHFSNEFFSSSLFEIERILVLSRDLPVLIFMSARFTAETNECQLGAPYYMQPASHSRSSLSYVPTVQPATLLGALTHGQGPFPSLLHYAGGWYRAAEADVTSSVILVASTGLDGSSVSERGWCDSSVMMRIHSTDMRVVYGDVHQQICRQLVLQCK